MFVSCDVLKANYLESNVGVHRLTVLLTQVDAYWALNDLCEARSTQECLEQGLRESQYIV